MVLGIDTHKDVHVAAVLDTTGRVLGGGSFPATATGYHAMLVWAREFGLLRRAGVECTGRPCRSQWPGQWPAKSSDGPVEMVRLFKLAKASAIKSRTQAINQLKAVLVSADPELRESLTELSRPALIRRCAQFDTIAPHDPSTATTYTLRLLAHRIAGLTAEIDDLNQQITSTIGTHAPQLLECHGVGPDTAAALLIAAGDNPGRLTSEASFAALCGVSPVEASSGKTRREAIRCLKRYVARELYRIITNPPQQPPPLRR